MSVSNKMTNVTNKSSENTVYFYPKKVKVSYSSLEDLKYYLAKVFSHDLRLEEKLKQCNLFIKNIIKEMQKRGIFDEDETMVITDPVIDKKLFSQIIEIAYNQTAESKTNNGKLTKLQILKRQILIAIFIKKNKLFKDFYNIALTKGEVYSEILTRKIDLQTHSKIKFRASKELEDYIINIISRKALLSQGCSILTLSMYIYIIMELVIWYSRGITLLNNKTEVDPETLSKSIKLVDYYYITNTNFINMLKGTIIGSIVKTLS